MKSYFELAMRYNPLVVTCIRYSYYRINKAWGVGWYLNDSSYTVAKLVNAAFYVELEPTYRGDCHRYWRRYR